MVNRVDMLMAVEVPNSTKGPGRVQSPSIGYATHSHIGSGEWNFNWA
jgi:hypothetical protein